MTETLQCQIQVKGHLTEEWSSWFGGLEIENQPEGEAILSGRIPDQAFFYGILDQIRNIGIEILSVSCMKTEENDGTQLEEDDTVTNDVRPLECGNPEDLPENELTVSGNEY